MDRFEHLSDAQLEQFGTATTGSPVGTHTSGKGSDRSGEATGASGVPPGASGDTEAGRRLVDSHLEDCADCRARLLQLQRLHFAPLADQSVKSEPSPGCPSKETIQNLAAGLPVAPADPAQLVQHAAECDHCGPLLRDYTEIFSDDVSDEEAAILEQLESSKPDWPEKMFRKILESQKRNKSGE